MRKLIMMSIFGAAMMFGFNSNAQSQGDFRASVGGILGNEAAINDDGEATVGFGVNAGVEYFISDGLSGAVSYDYFFESTVDTGFGEVGTQLSSINIDGRYYFSDSFYGLAGLSLAAAKATFGPVSATANETGLNIGAGAMLPMGDTMNVNIQAKYNTPLEQIIGQVGVVFAF